MTNVSLFIAYKAKPGKRDELHRAMEKFVKPEVMRNPGIVAFFICDDEKDGDTVRLFECYRDRAALDAVGKAAWLAEYNATIKDLLAQPAEVHFANPWWTKG